MLLCLRRWCFGDLGVLGPGRGPAGVDSTWIPGVSLQRVPREGCRRVCLSPLSQSYLIWEGDCHDRSFFRHT